MSVFVGKLVKLRPVQRADWPKIYEFRIDLETHLLADDDPPIPQSFEQVSNFWEEMEKKEPDNVYFAVEADEKLIGTCGLFHFDKTARSCELGISIGDKDYWGKGFGSDAVTLLVDFAFRHMNQHRVFLVVGAGNDRAVGAYRKVGFVEEGKMRDHLWIDGRYDDSLIMSILSTEWHSAS
jgi:RimJ/RimL family protein N-acetyltransferase